MVDKNVPHYLSRILPLEYLNLAAAGRHTAGQVAVEEELELERLKLAAVAVAAAPLPLAPSLEVPVPGATEQLPEGVLELVGGLAKEGVASSGVGQVVSKRAEINIGLPAEHHLLRKAVAVEDSFSGHPAKVGQVNRR